MRSSRQACCWSIWGTDCNRPLNTRATIDRWHASHTTTTPLETNDLIPHHTSQEQAIEVGKDAQDNIRRTNLCTGLPIQPCQWGRVLRR